MYNINPVLWGKHLWIYLHYLTLSYPDKPTQEDKQKMKEYFTGLWRYLPCEKCRINYLRHFEELPLTDETLENRDKFVFWLVDFHNIVNLETGKKQMTKAEFIKQYMNGEEDKSKRKFYIIFVLLFLVILLLLCIKFMK